MKKLFTLVYALFAFAPFAGYAQCSDQITLTYYVSGVLTSQTIVSGKSGGSVPVCPSAGALYSLSASSTSNSVLTVTKVITQGATPAADVVESPAVGSAALVSPQELHVSLSFATTTIFRVESKATDPNCSKDDFVYLTFTPTLTLVSNAPVSGVCNGGAVTLTAAGSTSGTYTWSANGVVIPGKTSSSITENPIDNTTYTVSTTTSCGTSSQQITIPVKTLSISPNAPFACTGQSTTITASYNGPSATYSWSILGQAPFATTSAVTVMPLVTTTYQVVAHTGTNDCGDITKTVTVTVGAPTVSVAPTAATVCSGSPTTLRATSNNPSAVFTWSIGAVIIATGSSVTVSPTTSTTYTVTATTSCGSPTATVALTVAPGL